MRQPGKRCFGWCFGTVGTHELPGLSSFHPENFQWQNSQLQPSSSSLSPSPPSPWSLAQRTAEKALPVGILLSVGIGHSIERLMVETSLSPLFLSLGLRQPCITIHTVSASCGPSQSFLYLRKDWEIWCTAVKLHSLSWMKRGTPITQEVFRGVHLSQVSSFFFGLERRCSLQEDRIIPPSQA